MSKKIIVILCVIASAMTMNFSSNAWGKRGHNMVAEVAFYLMDTGTQTNVRHYLNGMSIEQAANWMDEIKSEKRYDFMKPWHYLNIEKGQSYEPTKEPNVLNALNNAIAELEQKNKLNDEEIKKNILIIFHLVGDLHQPLHVGYGNDKGGNDIHVKYLNKESNLHRVWDSEIIESEDITLNNCLSRMSTFDKGTIDKFKNTNTQNWINQPRSLVSKAYNFEDNKIEQTYIDKNKTIIEDQILIAGIRLSAILEKLFKG